MYVIPIDGFISFVIVGMIIYFIYWHFKDKRAEKQKSKPKGGDAVFWIVFFVAFIYFSFE